MYINFISILEDIIHRIEKLFALLINQLKEEIQVSSLEG